MSEIKTLNGYAFADTKARERLGQMDIPKVFIDGTIPTTKDDVLAEMTYISKTETFHAYLKIKCQGTSSMSYPKKNFTVNLYSDESRETKLKKVFRDWGVESSKFVLKANYIDHSHARNIVCANLWDEVVSSRADYDTLPAELRNSPRNGAIDGFPIKVYTNGTYQGIYTWNIGKDAWMWGMNEDNPNHVLLCGETNTDGVYAENACNFRALWSGTDGNDWSIEVGTNSDALKTSLNNLISCVKDTDDATFKATIGNYLDVQSAIDYYIHMYVICGLDGLAKNMLLATYDGTHWMCGAYDMDSTIGLLWYGGAFAPANYKCPEQYQEQFSLLWERLETVFTEELEQRYAELRKTVYSYPNMVTRFERFMDVIGLDLYAEDLTVYPDIPSGTTNNIQQVRNYIRDRLVYCDEEFRDLAAVDSALYTFEEGVFDNGSVRLEVTNGNHVRLKKYLGNSENMVFNVSKVSNNIGLNAWENYYVETILFNIDAGKEVVFKSKNIIVDGPSNLTELMVAMKLYKPWGDGLLSVHEKINYLNGDVETKTTIENDYDVGVFAVDVTWTAATIEYTLDFDIEVYVDGVRYI